MAPRLPNAKAIAHGFQPREFNPIPIFRNAHVQTILGAEILSRVLIGKGRERTFLAERERWITPDDDFVDLDFVQENSDSSALILLIHGLEATPVTPFCTKIAQAFVQKGFKVVLMAHRGCSGEDNHQPYSYHMGFTEDVDFITKKLHERFPDKKMYLVGFSLGGNVALKFLGELGEKALERNICGAAITCVPFCIADCARQLDSGIRKHLYVSSFLQCMKLKAELKHQKFPGLFDIEMVRAAQTFSEFERAFVVPVWGFESSDEYYQQAETKHLLRNTKVPTVIINARDDPFIFEPALPTDEDVGDAPVKLVYHQYGGHCGFVYSQPYNEEPPHGFLAEELARAIDHVHGCVHEPTSSQHVKIEASALQLSQTAAAV